MNEAVVVLGNQLFAYKHYSDLPDNVFMCEDIELCTHFKYHKHKIIHFLASMREYRDHLVEKGKSVEYVELDERKTYISQLESYLKSNKIQKVTMYEIEDHFFDQKIKSLFESLEINVEFLDSPMFMTSRKEFEEYLMENEKPFMNSFYIGQRRKHEILLDDDKKPIGGSWSFDNENRKKIPKKFEVDEFLPPSLNSGHIEDVSKLVEDRFKDHPGEIDNYWIPTNRRDSLAWLRTYIDERFEYFGRFQDAIDERAPFLYHSVISPMMNIGFIEPGEVIQKIIEIQNDENLNSVEGFVRQVMGWREFVRGIYQNFDGEEQTSNFFDHNKRLTDHWYKGTTGIPPLDDAILKAQKWGYCHHIERLMVIGNLMLLLKIHPQEVFKWFMEMFVDSSDWVMGPNVFGMSQFSDGGLFATKPYISGSNYLLKMSNYKKGDWCDGVDGLYWRFIEEKKEFFSKNHRMSMMVSMVEKMDDEKKKRIYKAAGELEKKLTK